MRNRVIPGVYTAALGIPTVAGLSSFLLMLWQGGVGGGHGPLDQWIAWLLCPAWIIFERLPRLSDALPDAPAFLLGIVLLVNVLIFLLAAMVIHACCFGWLRQNDSV